MKLANIFLISLIITFEAFAQSTIVYDTGTTIEVTPGADICADVVTIQGTYTGSGTLCEGPLPVELTLFTATLMKNEIDLFWETETEVGNYGFEVERKINENEWSVLTFIKGNGNSNSPKKYNYIDKDLFAGGSIFQYRLKQIDTDGTFNYSDVVEVEVIPDQYELSQNYPNPFNPSTKISWQSPVASHQTLKVYDVLGNEVATLVNEEKPAGSYEVEFDASSLASGIYFYRLQSGSFNQTKKMILMK